MLNEDKAKSEIRQVLLSNDKAKNNEGKSNLFGVRELGKDTHPHNNAIAIIIKVHDRVTRKVLFSNDSSSNVPHNDAMKEPRIS